MRVLQPQTLQVTGLTRDGVFLVENGKVTAPVMNFRWNESPVRVLQNTWHQNGFIIFGSDQHIYRVHSPDLR